MSHNVNTVILQSIPMRKDLKRYYTHKYLHLCEHNGGLYAAEVFSDLRNVLLSYRADPHRMTKRDEYINRCPVRKNGWLKLLFKYMDSSPADVLAFLKLYAGMNQPEITTKEAAINQDRYLASVKVDQKVPAFLRQWLSFVLIPPWQYSRELHLYIKSGALEDFSKIVPTVGYHPYHRILEYKWKWWKILQRPKVTWDQMNSWMSSRVILPESYKDYQPQADISLNLERDLEDIITLLSMEWGCPVSDKVKEHVLACIDPMIEASMHEAVYDVQHGAESFYSNSYSVLHGQTVGTARFIPKKGTVKRRCIADANKVLQLAMVPIYRYLEIFVKRLPRDCTFDQNRLDVKIQNRVNNPNLYIGSVDLSQATDNLPLAWGVAIVDALFRADYSNGLDVNMPRDLADFVESSLETFEEISRAPWYAEGGLTFWECGQPLGTLPSFMMLALTHNLFLESLSLCSGYLHSPYGVLGDDVVIFTKKLRKKYIHEMTKRGMPLSLHKSFEGNLTEFAGKTYVRNNVPFLTPSMSPVTWESLFDYSFATGITIPWNHLPKRIRDRIVTLSREGGLPNGDAQLVYEVAQQATIRTRGSRNVRLTHIDYMESYFTEYYSLDREEPSPIPWTGLFRVGDKVVKLAKEWSYAEKHGHLQRFKKVELPEWYRTKYRPVATDKALHCAIAAVKDHYKKEEDESSRT